MFQVSRFLMILLKASSETEFLRLDEMQIHIHIQLPHGLFCVLFSVSLCVFPKGGLLDGRGRWEQRVAELIQQTFSSSKYHPVVAVPRPVSTREIRQEYFQERSLHRSLQKSNRSTTDNKFTASSFSRLLARHDGRVSKSDGTLTYVWVHGPGFTTCLL